MANRQIPCESYRSIKIFEFSASDFGSVCMRRRFCACAYDFLSRVTEGVVNGVNKIVIRSSFGVIWRHEVS